MPTRIHTVAIPAGTTLLGAATSTAVVATAGTFVELDPGASGGFFDADVKHLAMVTGWLRLKHSVAADLEVRAKWKWTDGTAQTATGPALLEPVALDAYENIPFAASREFAATATLIALVLEVTASAAGTVTLDRVRSGLSYVQINTPA